MKPKVKTLIRENSYYTYLMVALCSMFEWETPLEDNDGKFHERYCHEEKGFVAQIKDGKWYIAPDVCRVGDVNQFGLGVDAEGTTLGNGVQLSGTIGKDIAICYNNSMHMADIDLIRYTDALSTVDKTIMINVALAGLAPLLCAKDGKTADAISQLIAKLLDGEVKAITSQDILESLKSAGTSEGVYSVDVTHPERIKNVQYQSELYDVLLKRFFNKYGLNIQNSSKHAQASVDEVHGLDSVSWVLPLDMLKCRQDFCDMANKIAGEEVWKVRFAEPWASEYKKYMDSLEDEDEPDPDNEGTNVSDENVEGSEEDASEVDENRGSD